MNRNQLEIYHKLTFILSVRLTECLTRNFILKIWENSSNLSVNLTNSTTSDSTQSEYW